MHSQHKKVKRDLFLRVFYSLSFYSKSRSSTCGIRGWRVNSLGQSSDNSDFTEKGKNEFETSRRGSLLLQCWIRKLTCVSVCTSLENTFFKNQMTRMLSHLDNSTVNHRVFGNGACNETQFCHSPTGGYNEVENTGWRKTLMHFEIRKKFFN